MSDTLFPWFPPACPGVTVCGREEELGAKALLDPGSRVRMRSSRLAIIFGALAIIASTSALAGVKSSGSGFAIADGGLILTSNHVVKGCTTINIPDVGSGTLVSSDPRKDLAVLKPSRPLPKGLRFRSTFSLKLGEEVVVIGYPLRGLLSSAPTVTTGIVSSLAGIGNDRTEMQISAPVQPGNSGGPVLDRSGNVVGVVVSELNAIRAAVITGNIPQNVNFAIHSSIVTSFLDSYSIEYARGSLEQQKPISDIVSEAIPAVVVLECLSDKVVETAAIPSVIRPRIRLREPLPPEDLPARRAPIRAVISELRSCLSAVRSKPAYSTLLPHLRDYTFDSHYTMTQLADDRTPSPAEAEVLQAYIGESAHCKDTWLVGVDQILPESASIRRRLVADTQAILLQLVTRRLTWGAAAQREQQLLESVDGSNFPKSMLW